MSLLPKACYSRRCARRGFREGEHYHTPGGKTIPQLAGNLKAVAFRPGKTARDRRR